MLCCLVVIEQYQKASLKFFLFYFFLILDMIVTSLFCLRKFNMDKAFFCSCKFEMNKKQKKQSFFFMQIFKQRTTKKSNQSRRNQGLDHICKLADTQLHFHYFIVPSMFLPERFFAKSFCFSQGCHLLFCLGESVYSTHSLLLHHKRPIFFQLPGLLRMYYWEFYTEGKNHSCTVIYQKKQLHLFKHPLGASLSVFALCVSVVKCEDSCFLSKGHTPHRDFPSCVFQFTLQDFANGRFHAYAVSFFSPTH